MEYPNGLSTIQESLHKYSQKTVPGSPLTQTDPFTVIFAHEIHS